MSQQQSILNLIGIKDKNISFISCELEKLPHRGKLIEQKSSMLHYKLLVIPNVHDVRA